MHSSAATISGWKTSIARRPPPSLRCRSRDTASGSSSSRTPALTVGSDKPVACATAETPPQPRDRASAPAQRRRPRSSRSPDTARYFCRIHSTTDASGICAACHKLRLRKIPISKHYSFTRPSPPFPWTAEGIWCVCRAPDRRASQARLWLMWSRPLTGVSATPRPDRLSSVCRADDCPDLRSSELPNTGIWIIAKGCGSTARPGQRDGPR